MNNIDLRDVIDRFDSHHEETKHSFVRRQDVKTVVLICASSRGGSSYLYRKLAKSEALISPRGEYNPFVKMYLSSLELTGSDHLNGTHVNPNVADCIWKLLYFDLGIGFSLEALNDIVYELQLELRLPLQWPGLVHSSDVRVLLDELRKKKVPGYLFFQEIINNLSAQGKIQSGYYDRDPLLLTNWTPPATYSPPNKFLLEEPPFIPILPRRRPNERELASCPLLLKTSLNAYHLGFIRSFFPHSRLKIIHLTRNFAAPVNGLIDGWLNWGFYSYNLAEIFPRLDIKGYSDKYPWGDKWWNFDLFPGWQAYTAAPLPVVCLQQWLNAHKNILQFTREVDNIECLQVKFEDFITGPREQELVLNRITDFISIPRILSEFTNVQQEIVMATVPPRPGRWKKREAEIAPLITLPQIKEISHELGYSVKEMENWI